MIGTNIGPYRILAKLGEGGMGEVYRAHDSKLNRAVAIKILPPEFANDPDRLARFKREAQVLASLNHPNVGGIYGFEDSGSVHALVLELVEGPTLADLLTNVASGFSRTSLENPTKVGSHSRPLPIDEALGIARQIADALEAAHEQGIIHRDLKPANVKVRDDGTVKVLDFGLAKLADPAGAAPQGSPSLTQSPTITTPAMTQAGMILGTAAYMSPEQAKGRPADKRSDIWAFGCVLYEMLTGKRAFDGEDVSDTLAAILRGEPDWTRLVVRRPLIRLIQRCLAKDVRRRLQSIGDARLELEDIASDSERTDTTAAAGERSRARVVLWVAVATVAAVLSGIVGWISHAPASDARVYRSTILTPGDLAGVQNARIALSPDGRQIAFVTNDEAGKQSIWIRRLDEASPHLLPGTDGGAGPAWSPDGRYLTFTADGKLKKVSVAGGAALPIADADPSVPAAWSRDDTILFQRAFNGPLFKVSANGGASTQVTHLDQSAGETGHRLPVFLPDGRHFLYVALSGSRISGLFRGSLDDDTKTRIGDVASNVAVGSNALLYLRGETLVAQPFDIARATLTGPPIILADQVQMNLGTRSGAFTISERGQLAYQAGSATNRRLLSVDRVGQEVRVVIAGVNVTDVQSSPDGRAVALTTNRDAASQTRDLALVDLDTGQRTNLTSGPNMNSPIWSPDGKKLVFSVERDGHADLFVKDVAGPSTEKLLLADDAGKFALGLSQDGHILYARLPSGRPVTEIWVSSMDAPDQKLKLEETPASVATAKFSPDGRWIAYSTGGSTSQIFVATFPGLEKRPVTIDGGAAPRWSRDGKELFFVNHGFLMATAITAESGRFRAGAPKALFKVHFIGGVRDPYDVMPDGQHFLVQDAAELGEPITLLTNWPLLMQAKSAGGQ
jgi:eukaryotic-like serine/threonine-protein kinase